MGKYKKFYLSIIFIISLFLFTNKVNAESITVGGTYNSSDFVLSPYARFYDNINGSLTAVSTPIDDTYGFYFANFKTVAGGLGGAICFQLDYMLQPGYMYSVLALLGIYDGTSSSPYITTVSNYNYKGMSIGQSLTGAQNNFNSGSYGVDVYSSSYLYGNFKLNTKPNDYNSINSTYTSGIYMVFEPKQTGNTLCIPFTTSVTTDAYKTFSGYKLESLGVSTTALQTALTSSGLATAGAVSSVQSSVNQVQNEVNGMQEKQEETNQKLGEIDNTLNSEDSSGATDEAGNFFSGFETDTFGLTSIITAPLNLIESITSSTCSPMGLPIPFIEGQTLNLPCLRGIYENNFGTFYDIYKTITFGIVAYYICVKLFNLVKDFKNPEHDEIEVLEL